MDNKVWPSNPSTIICSRAVAQLGRAPVWGTGGRGFKSRRPDYTMTDASPPPDLARWSLHCFCLGARSTPHRIIRLDDNGELLHSAVGGTRIEDLVSTGLEVTESQLWLLDAYGLIERDGDHVETAFPVLGPEAVAVVRGAAEQAAAKALPRVGDEASRLVEELGSLDLAGHGFALIFGHALDGVLWDLLGERGGIPNVTLDLANPFWNGAFWALYPGRRGSAGTNELVGQGAVLVMVWDDDSADALRSLASNPEIEAGLFSVDRRTSRHLIPRLGPVPIVEVGGVLDKISRVLAREVVDVIPGPDGSMALLEQAGVAARGEEATVIVAHEVIWSMTELLRDSGVVTPPTDAGIEGRLFVRIEG